MARLDLFVKSAMTAEDQENKLRELLHTLVPDFAHEDAGKRAAPGARGHRCASRFPPRQRQARISGPRQAAAGPIDGARRRGPGPRNGAKPVARASGACCNGMVTQSGWIGATVSWQSPLPRTAFSMHPRVTHSSSCPAAVSPGGCHRGNAPVFFTHGWESGRMTVRRLQGRPAVFCCLVPTK